jgi:hypothetical protein
MSPLPLHGLTETRNELLLAQHEMIERMAARIQGMLVCSHPDDITSVQVSCMP